MSGPTRSVESASSWWRAGLALLIASLSFGAVTAVPILLKPLMAEWGVGAASISLVHTATLLGGGLGSLWFGRLLDRHGFFPLAVVAALAISAGLLLMSRAQSLWVLYLSAGVLIGAVGQGVFFSPLMVALSRWFDRHGALAMAVASCGQSVGGFLVPPLLRLGVQHLGWRDSLAWFSLLCLLVLLPAVWAFCQAPAPLRPAQGVSDQCVPMPGRRFRFWMYGLGFAVFNAVTFAVVGHLLAYGEERGFQPVAAAALMSVLLGSTLLFRLLGGLWMRRWGAYRVLLLSSTLHVAGVLVLTWPVGYAGLALGATAIGLGFGGYLPAYAVLVRDMFAPGQAGRRVAEINAFGFFAAGLGSGAAGWLRDLSGSYASALTACAALACAGWVMLVALRRALGDSPATAQREQWA